MTPSEIRALVEECDLSSATYRHSAESELRSRAIRIIPSLLAENERLRAALVRIVDECDGPHATSIAEEALRTVATGESK